MWSSSYLNRVSFFIFFLFCIFFTWFCLLVGFEVKEKLKFWNFLVALKCEVRVKKWFFEGGLMSFRVCWETKEWGLMVKMGKWRRLLGIRANQRQRRRRRKLKMKLKLKKKKKLGVGSSWDFLEAAFLQDPKLIAPWVAPVPIMVISLRLLGTSFLFSVFFSHVDL